VSTNGADGMVRIAAAGDVHCGPHNRDESLRAFAALEGRCDLVLLAGDLTTHGHPDQAAIVVEAAQLTGAPVLAVLGNHDHHDGCVEEVVRVLVEGGVEVLERGFSVQQCGGVSVGVVGTKGFVGGFPGSSLPDFGEPLLREVYAETTREAEAIDRGLQAVAHCAIRVVLLHYAPVEATLEGEPVGIHTFLGSERLAPPIDRHRPDLVLHGHAHAGRLRGCIGDVPVYNVSVPVMQRDFWLFEMSGTALADAPADVTLGTA
jgi:Icc-related predicted phosphoesterase